MSRLAAAHRALAQLYQYGAEATVDYLLTEAASYGKLSMRRFYYVDILGGHWILIESPLSTMDGGWGETHLLE
jgi:hypothetical protein